MARTVPVHAGYTILHGEGTGINGYRIDVWAEYLAGAPDTAANATPLTLWFYAALRPDQSSGTYASYGLYSRLTVDGVPGESVSSGAYDFRSQSNVVFLGSFSGNIPHAADGSKTVRVEGSFTTLSDYISGGNLSATVALPAIPRASSIAATDAAVGAVSMIAVGRKGGSYTHTIAYRFGQAAGWLTADGDTTGAPVTLSATAIPFRIPESFYAQIPNAKSGTCTLTCTTYSGSAQVGDAQSCSFTVTTLEELCKPEITPTVTDTNAAAAALTGGSAFVRYVSHARCGLMATPRNGASITQTRIAGVVTDALTLEGVESAQILFEATDSRGYPAAVTVNLPMLPYVRLTNNAQTERTDPTGGEAELIFRGSCYSGSFGAGSNTLSARYRVNGGAWQSVSLTVSGDTYTARAALSGLDYTAQHTVETEVTDALMTAPKTLTVKRGLPVFEWGENDFVFHVPVVFDSGFITKNLTKE